MQQSARAVNVDRRSKFVSKVLEKELLRLEKKLPVGESLVLSWRPQPDSQVSGEVRGNTLYVYSETVDEALETLRHEYIDYVLTRGIVRPLVAIVNNLIKLRETEIYSQKERIVAQLIKLL